MVRLESAIERDWCHRAAKLGYRSLKLVDQGNRGFPDRTVFGQNGEIFFIEFKRDEHEELKPHQRDYARELRARGFEVLTIWSQDQTTKLLEILEKAKSVK